MQSPARHPLAWRLLTSCIMLEEVADREYALASGALTRDAACLSAAVPVCAAARRVFTGATQSSNI
jgi:hypothetical protein